MFNWWDKNGVSIELGDERFSNRACSIGKTLSER
ncbi:IS4/Tn5 family transposase DNA-binding protein [Microcoleus sp. A6-C5]